MVRYHFYQTDSEGRFLHAVFLPLPDDEAALAKARELCEDCYVEIWKGPMKLAIIHNDASPTGAKVSEGDAPRVLQRECAFRDC